jgi:hypothetical protein
MASDTPENGGAIPSEQQSLQDDDSVEQHKQRTSTVGAHNLAPTLAQKAPSLTMCQLPRPACNAGLESDAAMARSQHARVAGLGSQLASILASRRGGEQGRGKFIWQPRTGTRFLHVNRLKQVAYQGTRGSIVEPGIKAPDVGLSCRRTKTRQPCRVGRCSVLRFTRKRCGNAQRFTDWHRCLPDSAISKPM